MHGQAWQASIIKILYLININQKQTTASPILVFIFDFWFVELKLNRSEGEKKKKRNVECKETEELPPNQKQEAKNLSPGNPEKS
jgi:hypothetical protein